MWRKRILINSHLQFDKTKPTHVRAVEILNAVRVKPT